MVTSAQTFRKDPNSVLDYGFDWDDDTVGPYLETGEIIATSLWIVPSGLTDISESVSDTVTKIVLSGGTEGESYRVTNRIVTTGGDVVRTVDRSFVILVEER